MLDNLDTIADQILRLEAIPDAWIAVVYLGVIFIFALYEVTRRKSFPGTLDGQSGRRRYWIAFGKEAAILGVVFLVFGLIVNLLDRTVIKWMDPFDTQSVSLVIPDDSAIGIVHEFGFQWQRKIVESEDGRAFALNYRSDIPPLSVEVLSPSGLRDRVALSSGTGILLGESLLIVEEEGAENTVFRTRVFPIGKSEADFTFGPDDTFRILLFFPRMPESLSFGVSYGTVGSDDDNTEIELPKLNTQSVPTPPVNPKIKAP